jgi:hypothetical protein
MNAQSKPARAAARKDYATKAKFEHALRLARIAGIEMVGSIELGADGTIRIMAPAAPAAPTDPAVDDEIARWRSKRGK